MKIKAQYSQSIDLKCRYVSSLEQGISRYYVDECSELKFRIL